MGILRREVQARFDSVGTEWQEVYSGLIESVREIEWTPPYSGGWRFRQRVFDDELRASAWAESGPYQYNALVDGATIHYHPTKLGECAPASLGDFGDINIPPEGGFVERKALPLQATPEYTDGVIAHLKNTSFSVSYTHLTLPTKA